MLNVVRKLLPVLALALPVSASAADVSLVKGFYKKSSEKVESKNSGSTSEFSLGGRFQDDLGGSQSWYGEATLATYSYTAPDGRKSPSNSVAIDIGGGVRHYFKPFGTAVVPFGAAGVNIRNGSNREVTWNTNGYEDNSINGLYYNAAIGLRTGLDSNFFVDLELPLFDSALFAVAKKVTVVDSPASETKKETTINQLWVESSASVTAIRVAVGYKF